MRAGLKIGNIVEAQVTRITDFGAFVKINGDVLGLIHISQVANSFVKDISEHLKVGDKLKARIIKLGPGKKIDLSLKLPVAAAQKSGSGFKSSDFEDKLKEFLKKDV